MFLIIFLLLFSPDANADECPRHAFRLMLGVPKSGTSYAHVSIYAILGHATNNFPLALEKVSQQSHRDLTGMFHPINKNVYHQIEGNRSDPLAGSMPYFIHLWDTHDESSLATRMRRIFYQSIHDGRGMCAVLVVRDPAHVMCSAHAYFSKSHEFQADFGILNKTVNYYNTFLDEARRMQIPFRIVKTDSTDDSRDFVQNFGPAIEMLASEWIDVPADAYLKAFADVSKASAQTKKTNHPPFAEILGAEQLAESASFVARHLDPQLGYQ